MVAGADSRPLQRTWVTDLLGACDIGCEYDHGFVAAKTKAALGLVWPVAVEDDDMNILSLGGRTR